MHAGHAIGGEGLLKNRLDRLLVLHRKLRAVLDNTAGRVAVLGFARAHIWDSVFPRGDLEHVCVLSIERNACPLRLSLSILRLVKRSNRTTGEANLAAHACALRDAVHLFDTKWTG